MSRVIFLEEARAEAVEAFRWYEKERRGLGKVFRGRLNDTIRRIRATPVAYPLQYRDLRRALVEQFPYAVFYRALEDRVVVVGVIHGKRDPVVWQRR